MSRRKGRAVDGVLLLDKPRGITSQTAVSRVKALFGAAKAGHTGTLDPLADGLLPVCLGEATKFSQGLLDADKAYRAIVRLGIRTATGDLEGEVLDTRPVTSTAAAIRQAAATFAGDILQVPPMYSALKRDGRPLYAYARAGEVVDREPRRVTIRSITVVAVNLPDVTIDVVCSKGTYIRVLAEDFGAVLGCGAALAGLTRTAVGELLLADAITFPALEATPAAARTACLRPVDGLVTALPRLECSADEARRLGHGQAFLRAGLAGGGARRAYDPDGVFLGMVEAAADGRIVPLRLVSLRPRAGPDGL